jgi:hypothetical protein
VGWRRSTAHLLQGNVGVRFKYWPIGAILLADVKDRLIVVDMLTFTTALTVATGRTMAALRHPLPIQGLSTSLSLRYHASCPSPGRPW